MVSPPSFLSGLTIAAALLILPRLTLASRIHPTPITTLTTTPLATPTPETLHDRRSANPGRPPEDRIEPLFTARQRKGQQTTYRGLTYKPNWLNGKIPNQIKELEKQRHRGFANSINEPYDSYDGGPEDDDTWHARRGVPVPTAAAAAEVEGDEQNLIVLPEGAKPTESPDLAAKALEEIFTPRPFVTLITRANVESTSFAGVAEAEATNTKTIG